MKSRSVETVTSNEAFVRMRIYDGDLPIDEAGAELLRIERAQHAAERQRHCETQERWADALAALNKS